MSVDEAIISQAASTYRNGDPITDLQAKVIANAWHGGQSSALYSLASTGAIASDTQLEIARCIDADPHDQSRELDALLDYVLRSGQRVPVGCWSDLSW